MGFISHLQQITASLNSRDWDEYGSSFTDDVVAHAPGLHTIGRGARVKWVHHLVAAFPDGRVTIDRAFEEGEWLCAELVFEGTHAGPLASADGPVPATHRRVRFPYCLVMRTEGARIAELHRSYDQLELLTQLGLHAST